MQQPVLRFAPSPNGPLHLGHALSALTNQAMASAMDGRLLLRIEDIDTERCTPEFEQGIYGDLDWLGVGWEKPARRQSEHFAEYGAMLDRLIRDELVYPAFMSRGEIRAHIAEQEGRGRTWPRDPDGVPLYPGLDKRLSKSVARNRMTNEAFAWRLDCAAAMSRMPASLGWTELADENAATSSTVPARPEAWGDVILARRDTATSYHLSVVTDDALQGVSHVVRGSDLFSATGVQRLLQELLGLPAPVYFHHRLVLGTDGRKLSKSLRSSGLEALRLAGHTPDDVRRMIGLR